MFVRLSLFLRISLTIFICENLISRYLLLYYFYYCVVCESLMLVFIRFLSQQVANLFLLFNNMGMFYFIHLFFPDYMAFCAIFMCCFRLESSFFDFANQNQSLRAI